MAKKRASRAKAKGKNESRASGSKRTADSARAAGKARQRPIELYYWPTPNGWKISIMLEECGLPYVMKPVNIGRGDQFEPDS